MKNTIQPLSQDEQIRLLASLERRKSYRDKTLIAMLLHAGISLRECVNLDIDDVELSPDRRLSLRIGSGLTATGKTHVISAPIVLRDQLMVWLTERCRAFCMKEERALFVTTKGSRLTASGVDHIVRQSGKSCGLELTTRRLRSTYRENMITGFSADCLGQLDLTSSMDRSPSAPR